MKYLFSCLEEIKRLLRGKFIFLFLDYDGTLTPIAKRPDKAVMSGETRGLLRQLSKAPDLKVAIVSGRSLKDISRRIDIKNIVYVGNHGFEIKGPKIKFDSPVPLRYRKILNKIGNKIDAEFARIRGVIVEDKGFSLSVHYRLADKRDVPFVKEAFYSTTLPYVVRDAVRISRGKMVLEVRPNINWDKGRVVLWLLARQKFAVKRKYGGIAPIYIGDDVTDEDAFKALKGKGITAFVGKPGGSEAAFYLKDTADVAKFLKTILAEEGFYN